MFRSGDRDGPKAKRKGWFGTWGDHGEKCFVCILFLKTFWNLRILKEYTEEWWMLNFHGQSCGIETTRESLWGSLQPAKSLDPHVTFCLERFLVRYHHMGVWKDSWMVFIIDMSLNILFWLVVCFFFYFSNLFHIGNNHPNWLTFIFFRRVGQPPTSFIFMDDLGVPTHFMEPLLNRYHRSELPTGGHHQWLGDRLGRRHGGDMIVVNCGSCYQGNHGKANLNHAIRAIFLSQFRDLPEDFEIVWTAATHAWRGCWWNPKFVPVLMVKSTFSYGKWGSCKAEMAMVVQPIRKNEANFSSWDSGRVVPRLYVSQNLTPL